MKSLTKQQGMGFFGLIYHLIVIGAITYTFFLLGPIYLENKAVKDSMAGINKSQLIKRDDTIITAKRKIRNYLADAFRRNNVVSVPLENIVMVPAEGGYQLTIKYDVSVNAVANVDFLVSFDDVVAVVKN